MNVKLIIKEMLQNGQSKEEILANLQELGIQNPEQMIQEAVRGAEIEKPSTTKQVPQGGNGEKSLADIRRKINSEKGATPSENAENEITEEGEKILGKGKSLFDNEMPREIFEKHEMKGTNPAVENAVEEIPRLELTHVTEDGEKIENIEEMLGKGNATEEIMKSIPKTSFSNTDDVESKLDDLMALVKALQEINRKILETNRDILLHLKK